MKIRTGRIYKVLLLSAALIFVWSSLILAQDSVEKLEDGNRVRNAGRLSEAETIYRSLLEDPAVDEAAREALAQVLLWQGKYDDAIVQYQELRKRYPEKSSEADIGMARGYAWGGDFRRAVEVAERGLAEQPQNTDLLLLLGQVESWAGHTKRSLAAFDRLLAKDPGNREALLGRGRALSWSGNFVEAERQFRAIIAEHMDEVEARVALVHNLIWMGRFRDAREAFEQIDQKDLDRRDVRLAKVALSRALGERTEYRGEIDSLRAEFPGDTDVRRFSRLEVDDFGPHIRTRAMYVEDSDDLEVIRYALGGAFPLGSTTFLFFEGIRGDLSYPRQADATASSAIIGIDTALARGFVLRVWGGSRMAEDADNEVIGGTTLQFKTWSNMQLLAGYDESFADYTPMAVRNNVRQKTVSLDMFWPVTPRFAITGDASVRKYEGSLTGLPDDRFSQTRDYIGASFRWALPAVNRLRTDVGLRATYFQFDEYDLDNGYYDPSDFKQILGFVTLTQRYSERTRVVLDLAYGTKKVAERDWESAGDASFIVFLPISEKIDLTGRMEYSRISITTGNYSTRAASLGLLFRLK